MRVTVIGKQKFQGKSIKSGRELNGTIVYFTCDSPEVVGVMADSALVSSNLMSFSDIKLGKDLVFGHDRFGYLISVVHG